MVKVLKTKEGSARSVLTCPSSNSKANSGVAFLAFALFFAFLAAVLVVAFTSSSSEESTSSSISSSVAKYANDPN